MWKLVCGLLFCFILSSVSFRFAHSKHLKIVTRHDWNAALPVKQEHLKVPVDTVIIAHTATERCETFEQCKNSVKLIQKYLMERRHFDDIVYNFLVGGSGEVFEGRGWDVVGAHKPGYNVHSTCIALIGDFENVAPTSEQLQAVSNLIEFGVHAHKISPHYKLYGQKSLKLTKSPGAAAFEMIKTLPHFTEKVIH